MKIFIREDFPNYSTLLWHYTYLLYYYTNTIFQKVSFCVLTYLIGQGHVQRTWFVMEMHLRVRCKAPHTRRLAGQPLACISTIQYCRYWHNVWTEREHHHCTCTLGHPSLPWRERQGNCSLSYLFASHVLFWAEWEHCHCTRKLDFPSLSRRRDNCSLSYLLRESRTIVSTFKWTENVAHSSITQKSAVRGVAYKSVLSVHAPTFQQRQQC